jgi:hypothetical protein
MDDKNRKEKLPIREESYFKNDDIENENDSQDEYSGLYFMFPDFLLNLSEL